MRYWAWDVHRDIRIVANAGQGDDEVRIGRITFRQSNLSMADAAVAVSRLESVRVSPDEAMAGFAHECSPLVWKRQCCSVAEFLFQIFSGKINFEATNVTTICTTRGGGV